MSTNENAIFLEGSLLRHVAVMSVTASVGLMAVFLVDFIDMVFISMLGNAELAAAVGYSGSILFFTTSLSIGMAIAAGALVAKSIGQNNTDIAQHYATNTLIFGVVIASVFSAIVYVSLPFLTSLVGATGETQVMAIGYLKIIIPSLPILVAGMVGSAVLRAHGNAKASMYATLAGAAVNGVLDPILIFGLDLELTGAALASVAARFAIAFAALWPLIAHHSGLTRPEFSQLLRDLPAVIALAFPAILTQLATPVGSAIVIRAMAQFGESAVAGMAMVARMAPVAFAVVFALSGAIGPIIGQNFGARKFDRVFGALRDGVLFSAAYILLVSALLFLTRDLLADLFSAEGLARELVYLFCGFLALTFFFNAVIFISNSAFNNLGHPFYSTMINWGRNTVGTIPFVILGASYYGAKGVLIGQALGGVFFAAAAWMLARYVVRKQSMKSDPSNEPKPFLHRSRMLQLFHHRR